MTALLFTAPTCARRRISSGTRQTRPDLSTVPGYFRYRKYVCVDAPRRHFGILTKVTALTRLLASTKSPSCVTEVLRTMLPPHGMVQLWYSSVGGSQRTTVFGVVPDSLYQMMSSIAEMP